MNDCKLSNTITSYIVERLVNDTLNKDIIIV